MVDVRLTAKLADFGESKSFDQQSAQEQGFEGGEVDALTMTMVGTSLYCKCVRSTTEGARRRSSFSHTI